MVVALRMPLRVFTLSTVSSRTTIMRDPTNPIYLDTYAWIMHLLGDCEPALFYIKRAIEHSTEEIDKEIQQHYKEIKKKCK